MAFGQTRAQEARKQAKTEDSGEETQTRVWPYIPIKAGTADKNDNPITLKGGLRRIRMLPALDEHGNLVKVPATDRYGEVIKNGGMVTIPESEVRYVEIWWSVMVNGKMQKRQFWIDWQGEGRWKNPFWAMANETDKGSDERKALKEYFLINVVDKTPVLFDDKGYPVYPDEKGKFCINALGNKLDTPLTGEPQPLNQIRILQGTSGRTDPPGKHFFQQFVNMIGTVEDEDDAKKVFQLHEFDISINVHGAGKSTSRSANSMMNRKPLPDSLVYAPRYDLAAWAKPWPNDAISDLLDGADYFETMKKYEIQQYPQLKAVRPEAVEEQEQAVAEPAPRATRGKRATQKLEEPAEEDLFED